MLHLKIEAKVSRNSQIVGKTIGEIERDYGVKMLGQRIIKNGRMERLNPPRDSVVEADNYLEFSGDSEKVMKLFLICERA